MSTEGLPAFLRDALVSGQRQYEEWRAHLGVNPITDHPFTPADPSLYPPDTCGYMTADGWECGYVSAGHRAPGRCTAGPGRENRLGPAGDGGGPRVKARRPDLPLRRPARGTSQWP